MNSGEIFVLGIIAITTLGGVFKMWVRTQNGLPVGHSDIDAADGPDARRKFELLSTENERLTGQISRLEERLRVLERIATDPAERTAREIDSLR